MLKLGSVSLKKNFYLAYSDMVLKEKVSESILLLNECNVAKNTFKNNNFKNSVDENTIVNRALFYQFLKFLEIKEFELLVQKDTDSADLVTCLAEFFEKTFVLDDIRPKFYNQLIITYFLLIRYKKARVLYDFFKKFFCHYQYKTQKSLHQCILKTTICVDHEMLENNLLLGYQIKMKGKYTQRAGDRRKVYFYRRGQFSVNSPIKKYIIEHRQLVDKSGATGCTVIFLMKKYVLESLWKFNKFCNNLHIN